MARGSDNLFPSVLLAPQTSPPAIAANPLLDYAGIAAGQVRIYLDAGDGQIYSKDSAGVLTPLTAPISAQGIATEADGYLRTEAGQLILTGE